jgi:hypothetical protein
MPHQLLHPSLPFLREKMSYNYDMAEHLLENPVLKPDGTYEDATKALAHSILALIDQLEELGVIGIDVTQDD